MNAKIDLLTPAEKEWIVQQLKEGKAYVQQVLGKESEDLPSPEDLDQTFNTWMHSPTHDSSQANAVINFIGVAFGQHLANTSPLEWVIASDDYGTALALYAFPWRRRRPCISTEFRCQACCVEENWSIK